MMMKQVVHRDKSKQIKAHRILQRQEIKAIEAVLYNPGSMFLQQEFEDSTTAVRGGYKWG